MDMTVVNEVLTKGIEAATATGEFLADQVPEVIMQLLLWTGASNVASCLMAIAWIVAACWLASTIIKRFTEARLKVKESGPYDPDVDAVVLTIVRIVQCIVVPIAINEFYESFLIVLKVWLAPKLFLLEYAATLVK